jgi:hypothetical protein
MYRFVIELQQIKLLLYPVALRRISQTIASDSIAGVDIPEAQDARV